MLIDEYKRLCTYFDYLLTNSRSSSSRVAIEWLHFIRPHPHFIRRYDLLYGGFALSLAKRIISYSSSILKTCIHCLFSFSFTRSWFVDLPSADICFVSHLTDSSQLKIQYDPYFGNLPSDLSDSGFSAVTVLINHTQSHDTQLASSSFDRKIAFLDRLDFFSEISIIFTLISSSSALLLDGILAPDFFSFKICLVALIELFSPSSFSNHRYSLQLKYLLSKTNSKYLITTFEGFGWERFLFAHARMCNPKIICCGYQHSSIFPHHHSIRRGLNSFYDPDILFTSGVQSFKFFSKSTLSQNSFLSIIGSPKSYHTSSSLYSSLPLGNNILILPEGIKSEAELILKFTIASASLIPNYNFIFRMHPVLPLSSLSSLFDFSSLPSNIVLSDNSFHEDLKHSSFALYRGSTSIVEAINRSIIPIYLHISGDISINPLHLYNGKLLQVSSSYDLSSLICNTALFNYDLKSLQHFVSTLFCPLSLPPVVSTLKNFGQSDES